jgi:hypothetical protein
MKNKTDNNNNSNNSNPIKGAVGFVTASSLSQDLRRALNNAEYSDCTFNIRGKILHGHKAILTARSSYFKMMFSSGMKEATNLNEHIEITDFR